MSKDLEGKSYGIFEGTITVFTGEFEETMNRYRISGSQAEIQTKCLSNSSLENYHCTFQLILL
jgi:hypothetical protein